MPYIEIKSVLPCPSKQALIDLSTEVGNSLGIPKTSRMRISWNTVDASESAGLGENLDSHDLSQVVLLYTRSEYPQENRTEAMKALYKGVSELTGAAKTSVLVCHIPIGPGSILSSNGLWDGGDRYLNIED